MKRLNDKNINEKMVELILEYERLYNDEFWEMAKNFPPKDFEKLGPDLCGERIRKILAPWFTASNDIIGGWTPVEFVGTLSGKDTVDFLELIYEHSSDVIENYAEALKSRKEILFVNLTLAYEKLIKFPEAKPDGLFFELGMLFSLYQDKRALDIFIDFVLNAPPEHDDLVDFVHGLILDFGDISTDKLLYNIAEIADSKVYEGRVENLYSVLSQVGNESDQVFETLIRFFKNAPNKTFAAFCLETYGDERAIPVMHAWIEKNAAKKAKKDKPVAAEYIDVLSAMKKLGAK